MHCDHCVRRYERESVAVEAVCVVSLYYGHCDTATRNCATEWSLRVTATQPLKKGDIGKVYSNSIDFVFKKKQSFVRSIFSIVKKSFFLHEREFIFLILSFYHLICLL